MYSKTIIVLVLIIFQLAQALTLNQFIYHLQVGDNRLLLSDMAFANGWQAKPTISPRSQEICGRSCQQREYHIVVHAADDSTVAYCDYAIRLQGADQLKTSFTLLDSQCNSQNPLGCVIACSPVHATVDGLHVWWNDENSKPFWHDIEMIIDQND